MIHLSTQVIQKDNCLGKSMSDVFKAHLLPEVQKFEIEVDYSSKKINGGVVLKYKTRVNDLEKKMPIKHVFFFPRIEECREKSFVVSPNMNSGETSLNLIMQEGEVNYVNATVYGPGYKLLRTDVLVFDSKGNIYPYKESDEMYSTLKISPVQINEITEEQEKKLNISFKVLTENYENNTITIAMQTNGIYIKFTDKIEDGYFNKTINLTKQNIIYGNWLLAISDAEDRMIGQALFYVSEG